MNATATYTVEAATGKATVNYNTGRQMVIRGFFVVSPAGRRVRAFAQGTAQKWTPAVEADLRAKAEAWAVTLTQSSPRT